jgi:acyl-CoA synthetase (AMP-forming)/AMP-acid ligase II
MSAALTVPGLLGRLARSRPAATAVVTPEASLTYRDLLERSTRLAARLVRMGARKGTVIALLLPNGTDWVCWWTACARIGAVVVPMNTFAAPAEVQRVLEHSGAHLFVAVPGFAGRSYRDDLAAVFGESGPGRDRTSSRLPQLRRVLWLDTLDGTDRLDGTDGSDGTDRPDGADGLDDGVVEALAADVVPADVLTIIYSSGSTGDPKGVLHSHGATLRQAERLARLTDTQPSTVLWTSMPLNWVGGLVWSFLRAITAGGTFVTQARFEPTAALRLFTEAKVNTITAWGPVFEQLRQSEAFSTAAFGHIDGLAEVSAADVEGRPSALGMTETLGPHSGWSSHLNGGDDPDGADDADGEGGVPDGGVPEGAAGSHGRAMPGMEHRVVDPDTRAELPEGRPGELLVRGDTLMLGLHRRERGDVYTPDGWYPTGDGAVLRNGWLFFTGRLNDVIKTAGANVSPDEVRVVLEDQPSVRQAFVVGIPHAVRGEDVAAVVVPEDGALDERALLAAARQRLASYKVPRRLLVVGEEDIPWLSSQKVDVRRLRAMVVEP